MCTDLSPVDIPTRDKQAEPSREARTTPITLEDTEEHGKAESGLTGRELEAALVRAVTWGAIDVARTLAAELEERRRARAGNVIPFDAQRRKQQARPIEAPRRVGLQRHAECGTEARFSSRSASSSQPRAPSCSLSAYHRQGCVCPSCSALSRASET